MSKDKVAEQKLYTVEITPTEPLRVCINESGEFVFLSYQTAKFQKECEKLAKACKAKEDWIGVLKAEEQGNLGTRKGLTIWKNNVSS